MLNCVIPQSLYKARENEIETEQHFKALAERERGRLKSEIKRLEDEIVSLREKKNSQEVRLKIFKRTPVLQLNFMTCPHLHLQKKYYKSRMVNYS